MALVPPNNNWQVVNIYGLTHVIYSPGTEEELVFLKFDSSDKKQLRRALNRIIGEKTLFTSEEKSWAMFWVGYFYAHRIRGVPDMG
jgi:hypothetical protein